MTNSPSIVSVEAIPVVVTGDRDFRISEGGTRTHVSVILRLLTDIDGLEGNAEIVSAPPGKPEEFLEEILAAARNHLAPALVGKRVADRNAASARTNKSARAAAAPGRVRERVQDPAGWTASVGAAGLVGRSSLANTTPQRGHSTEPGSEKPQRGQLMRASPL